MAKYLDLTGLQSYDGKLKQWVNSVVDALKNGAFQVVEAVPEPGEAQPMVIYLVANEGSAPNAYDEYILVGGAMEKIGTTEISLDGYATDEELTQAINALKAELQQAINGKADSGQMMRSLWPIRGWVKSRYLSIVGRVLRGSHLIAWAILPWIPAMVTGARSLT